MQCKNCKVTFEGNYCCNCGQSAHTHRLNIKHFTHEALHTFTHLDTGILYLIKELFVKPGEVALEYVEGARKKYYPPLQFLILCVAACTFLTVTFHLISANESVMQGQSQRIIDFTRQFNDFAYKYYNVIVFLGVPVNAVFTFLFFKSTKFNYSENLILNTFLSAQHCVLYILFFPFLYFFRDYYFYVIGLYFIISSFYFIWGSLQFFKPRTIAWPSIKLSLIVILHLLVNMILTFTVFLLFIYKK